MESTICRDSLSTYLFSKNKINVDKSTHAKANSWKMSHKHSNQSGCVPLPSIGKRKSGVLSGSISTDSSKKEDHQFLHYKSRKLSFRSVVRVLMRASRWKVITLVSANDEVNKPWYENGKNANLHFNVNAFKAGTNEGSFLSKKTIYTLLKNAWERTNDDLAVIHTFVSKMKCFAKYTNTVRKELAKVVEFDTFEDGRVILKEGHEGLSMYFIITGSVIAQASGIDRRTGEKRNRMIGEISAGSSFGELALIQRCKRTATIVCRGTSHFLRVDKPDFDKVLRKSYEHECQHRLQLLKSLPFFSNWSDFDLRYINLSCRDVEFDAESVILGNTAEETEHVYFVVRGFCRIVRKMTIIERYRPKASKPKKFSLPQCDEDAQLELGPNDRLSQRFLIIGQLRRGDYFGVGENFKSTFVLAYTRVECLVVPRHVLLSLERYVKIYEVDTSAVLTLEEMRILAQSRLLSNKEVFDRWMDYLAWDKYKKKVLKDVLDKGRHPVIGNQLSRRQNTLTSDGISRFSATSVPLGYPTADFYPKKDNARRRAGYQRVKRSPLPPLNKLIDNTSKKQMDRSNLLQREGRGSRFRRLFHALESRHFIIPGGEIVGSSQANSATSQLPHFEGLPT